MTRIIHFMSYIKLQYLNNIYKIMKNISLYKFIYLYKISLL